MPDAVRKAVFREVLAELRIDKLNAHDESWEKTTKVCEATKKAALITMVVGAVAFVVLLVIFRWPLSDLPVIAQTKALFSGAFERVTGCVKPIGAILWERLRALPLRELFDAVSLLARAAFAWIRLLLERIEATVHFIISLFR